MGRIPWRLAFSITLASAWLAAGISACGPEPVGVDDCRSIETARCEAALACGIVSDLESCTRFYRDHCLHGLAAPETPGGAKVTDCVEAIQRVGSCAEKDPEQSVEDCRENSRQITPLRGADLENVCDVVREPERVQQCAFLSLTEGEGGGAGDSGD